MSKVIPFIPKDMDKDFIWTDEDGINWFLFAGDYKHEDKTYSFRIWGKSHEDALSRINSIHSTASLVGQMYGEEEL